MKSTEQLTADILCRAEETQKRQVLHRKQLGAVLGVFVLVVVLGVGVWQITLHRQTAVTDNTSAAQTPTEPTTGLPDEAGVVIPKLETKLPAASSGPSNW